jgi:anti-sigma factor ChrR (cupin superfamily)
MPNVKQRAATYSPQTSVRRQLMAELRGRERYTPFARDVAQAFSLHVDDARQALRTICELSAWQRGPMPGGRTLQTPALRKRSIVIADIPAGTRIAEHTHTWRELTFVIDGALQGNEHCFGPGSLIDMPVGSSHRIAVQGDHACLAVFCFVRP